MRVAIIGAGLGGLAAAIDLAVGGAKVTVVDRASAPGGKMRELSVGGRAIDSGPTVFTMRWVFEELFAHAGEALSDRVTLHKATTLARHAWEGPQQLDLFADRARSADAIGAFAGAAEARGYLAFCKEARRMYETLERSFMATERPSLTGFVARVGVVRALQLKPYELYMTELGRHFRDRRLRQMFGRYATYCGTSPYQAAATLMLVAHVEQEGVWLVEGGMHRVAAAMEALARKHGVTFLYDTQVAEIMVASGRATGVRMAGGDVVHADAVVMNGAPAALATGLLGRPAKEAGLPAHKFPERSLSAATWSMLADVTGAPLVRHNVFFSNDYPLEFKMIQNGLLPTEPTTYICAQDRSDSDGPVPDGAERLLLLVNAPPSGDRRAFSQVEIEQCMQGVSGLLDRCGVQIRATEPPVLTSPAQFHRLFPASGGALYGQATLPGNGSFKRAGARTKLPGLYLAGGSVHPGAGVPMVTLSGRIAAASILQDLEPSRSSMRLFRKRVTPGGTSMR
jgi:1-hydroxycarotenoid 3,4-desaturase